MDTAFAALGRFVVRFRYLIVLVWIAVTIMAIVAFPSLGSVIKSMTISDYLPRGAPSVEAVHLALPFQNTQYASAIIVATHEGAALTPADQAAIDQLEARVRAMPHVKVVRDLSLSPDGVARQAEVQADVDSAGTGTGAILVNDVRDAFGQVNAPAGLTFHLTGDLATTVDTLAAQQASQNAAQRLTYLLIIVLLFLAFRALLAPLLTLIPAAMALALSGPVIAGAVTRFGVQASSITQVVLIVLVLGAGTDYGLFLTYRVREELRRGLDPKDAVARALQTVGETITFSALTVIAALSTLVIAQFASYQSLGPALAIGIAVMLLAGLTLLPALLAIFGRIAFWPTSTTPREDTAARGWSKLAAGLVRQPAITLGLGLILFVGLAAGQLGTSLSGFGDQTSGPAGADSSAGTAIIDAHYPTAAQVPTAFLLRFPQSVWDQPGSLDTAEHGLADISIIRSVLGPLNPNGEPITVAQLTQLHAQLGDPQTLPAVPPPNLTIGPREYNAYRAIGQYISADGKTVRFLAILKDSSSSPAALDAIPSLRAAVDEAAHAAGASENAVFSRNAFTYDILHTSESDLSHIIPIVAVLIALLLAVVLRSLIAPLYLVASVVLSYLAAWGLVAIVFVHLGQSDGVNFIVPFVLFVFLMALGSDYNILVMRRIREEASKLPLRQAVREALTRTSGTVTAAGMILAGTFAVLAVTATNEQNRQFGFGVAAGILMDTFLIRTLLIPALVVLLGRWNWWPAQLFRSANADEFIHETADHVDVK
ncbi:MAG TPA: MMPL family transporter [Ktedonobacterales bacterium]|nr:MMPL family transporter [Ktedonobacterales bacterium]